MSDNGDQQDRDNRQRDPDNDPPHSRVFIVCGKGTTEEELEAEFKPYGQLQYPLFIQLFVLITFDHEKRLQNNQRQEHWRVQRFCICEV